MNECVVAVVVVVFEYVRHACVCQTGARHASLMYRAAASECVHYRNKHISFPTRVRLDCGCSDEHSHILGDIVRSTHYDYPCDCVHA